MITGQIENEECDYEFCLHSCVPLFRIKTYFYIALTKAIPNIWELLHFKRTDLKQSIRSGLNGTIFWISYQRLAFLSILSHWQLISNSAPSTIVWCQCDIQIALNSMMVQYWRDTLDNLYLHAVNWDCHQHSAYSWNIKWQKCARMGLNGFHIKWMISTHCNWKNQILGAVLELPAKQHCRFGQWAGLAVLFSW